MERSEAYRRLVRVRNEFDAARVALAYTLAQLEAGVRIVRPGHVALPELRASSNHLEITFVLRLFAEYEGVLMSYWANGMGRVTRPKVSVLMNRIADHQSMSQADLGAAHDVRTFRNEIVHEEAREPRLTFPDCASRIGTYLRWLPVRW